MGPALFVQVQQWHVFYPPLLVVLLLVVAIPWSKSTARIQVCDAECSEVGSGEESPCPEVILQLFIDISVQSKKIYPLQTTVL